MVVDDALRAFVERDAGSAPHGDGGVHFHRVVGLDRRAVGCVDLYGRGGEGRVRIAAMAFDLGSTGSADGWHGIVQKGADVGLFGVVLHADCGCRGLRLLKCFCNYDRYILSPVEHGRVGEGWPLFADPAAGPVAIDGRHVAVMEQKQHARHLFCGGGVHAADCAVCNCRAHGDRVDHAWEVVISRVGGLSGRLECAVDAWNRGADDGGRRRRGLLG